MTQWSQALLEETLNPPFRRTKKCFGLCASFLLLPFQIENSFPLYPVGSLAVPFHTPQPLPWPEAVEPLYPTRRDPHCPGIPNSLLLEGGASAGRVRPPQAFPLGAEGNVPGMGWPMGWWSPRILWMSQLVPKDFVHVPAGPWFCSHISHFVFQTCTLAETWIPFCSSRRILPLMDPLSFCPLKAEDQGWTCLSTKESWQRNWGIMTKTSMDGK